MVNVLESKLNRTEINFGTRILGNRCTSKVIAIPKIALENLSQGRVRKFQIKLIHEDGRKFLELIPILELKTVIN